MSSAGAQPPTDPPDPPDGPVTTDSEQHDTPEDDWQPESPGAWGGSEEARGEWRPEDPRVWEGVRGRGQALRPGRIRRTKYHRRIVRRSRDRTGSTPFDLSVRSRGGRRRRGFKGRSGRRRILKLIFLTLVILVLGAIAALADAYYQSYRIYKDVRGIPSQLAAVRQQLALGEVPPDARFAEMTREVGGARHTAESRFSLKIARVIPFFNRPVVAVDRGLDAAAEETLAATGMRDIVRDALGDVAGQSRFAAASSTPIFHDGKVDVALLQSLTPRLETVAQHLHAADRAIRAIPTVPFVHKLDSVKTEATTQSSQALALIQDALSGVKLLPSFLGADSPKTYFLAMQNNSDQRATGGAVLAYAFVKIDKGKLDLTGGGSVYDFDKKYGFSGLDLPSAIAWYLDHVPNAYPRLANINYSPDFPVVSQAWSAVLEKATGKKIDGAIAIDPVAVSYLLGKRVIRVPSYDKAITENNIVKVVENDQYRLPFAEQQAFPGQLIGQAWEILKNPTPFVRTLKQMATGIKQKHIQLWSVDPELQAELEKLGWDGGLHVGQGDYLYVTDNKIRSNKVDYYTHVSVDYSVEVDAQGNAHATCQVTMGNDAPPGETHFIIGPNGGLNEALIGLFVPKGATLESSDPRNGPPDHIEGGANVFVRTLRVQPGDTKVARFVYTVPGVVSTTPTGKVYRLSLQHQPFVNEVQLSVEVTFPTGTVITSAPGWTVKGNVATLQTELTQDLVREIHF